MLQETVPKALLKLRSTASTALPLFTKLFITEGHPGPLLHIFPSLPFAHTSAEALPDLHVFDQMQLQARLGSPDPNRACSHCVFIFLPGDLSLLPPLTRYTFHFFRAPCASMQASCHSCSTFCTAGWTTPELGDSKPWKKSRSFPGPLFSSS